MKRCTKCNTEKPEDAFEMQPSRGHLRSECKDCRVAAQREWRAKRKQNPPEQKAETKQCIQCQTIKNVSEFSPSSVGYFHPRCKECERQIKQEKRREHYQNNPTGRFYRAFANENGIMVRRCTACHTEKPVEEFYMQRGRRRPTCKVCDAAERKTNYDSNPEKYRTIARERYRKNPDKYRERYQRWHKDNQNRRLQYYRNYNEIHREKRRAYDRIRHSKETPEFRHEQHKKRREYYQMYRERFGDRLRLYGTLWRQTFPEKHVENQQRRRARKLNATIIEKIDRMALIERDNWTCYLCGCVCTQTNVTLDHVIPLSRGGCHSNDNLRVACRLCNSRKGAKDLESFINPRWKVI